MLNNCDNKIKSSDVHQYTNTILKNIDTKYENTVFPYTENNPICIYFLLLFYTNNKSSRSNLVTVANKIENMSNTLD